MTLEVVEADVARLMAAVQEYYVSAESHEILPNGGRVFQNAGLPPNGLLSPLSTEQVSELAALLDDIKPGLGELGLATYLPYLLSFNGLQLLNGDFFLYGLSSPRSVNVEDYGWYPEDLARRNYYDRVEGIGVDELIVGGAHDPGYFVTMTRECVFLHPRENAKSRISKRGLCDVWEFLLCERDHLANRA
ncbi:MAG: hypothetical protein KDA53_14370 [Hyphomonas sp.]|nr:hypothetical protein [Hyphomonas sp.]